MEPRSDPGGAAASGVPVPADAQPSSFGVFSAAELVDRVGGLEAEAEWSHVLSLGEQQRVAFLRLLLHAPKLAFLDEATGALDSATEAALYTALQRHCSSYVSVGALTPWNVPSAAAALWLPARAPVDLCITPTGAVTAAAGAALGVSFTLERIIMPSMAHG